MRNLENISWLENIGKNDTSITGGKGARLGELKKAGFPVPDGFVINTHVFDNMMTAELSEKIQNILSKLNVENSDDLEKASKKIQSLLISKELPSKTKKEIIESYKKLGGLVAVRSSATAEDLKDASFAGQLSTFLNVKEDKLLESVKKCIASLFTARAIYYRTQKKFNHMKVSIAVVIQKMIDSKKAGVAFSVNPVTNNKKEMIIEATTGLGETVVGGKSIPDNYVILKETDKVKERRISKKSPVLTDSEINKLSGIVKNIEEHYNFPQDVEWAIDDKNKMYILQSRPITTLRLTQKTVWKKIIAREYRVQYTEVSLRSLSPECKFIVPEPFYEQVYIPEDVNEVCYVDEDRWNSFVSSLKKKYLDNPQNYEKFEKLFMETGNEYMKMAERITKTNLKDKNNSELKEMYLDYQKKSLRYAPFIWIQFLINNFFANKVKEIITSKLGADNKNLYDFYEVALKPEKKASSIQLNEIASEWGNLSETEKIKVYEKFRWIPCLDIHNRPWTKNEFFSHISEFKKVEKKSPVSYELLIDKIKPSKEEQQILDITKRLAYLKDLKDDFRRQAVFFGQNLFKEIAERMGVGVEDISYMLQAEIVDFLEDENLLPKKIINERKEGFVIYYTPEKRIECKTGNDVNDVLNDIGLVIFEEFSEEMKGIPASPGKAKGTVVIVKGVSDLRKVKEGDIIVALTTHPDYVPAMQKASAIVTDEGGITSHAAIVSRELKLPCIVGTKYATKHLKDGDEIEIDADDGFVRKIKK